MKSKLQLMLLFILSMVFIIHGCSTREKPKLQIEKDSLPNTTDGIEQTNLYVDSIKKIVVDTTTIKGKINFLKNKTNIEIDPASAIDTLFDLNYDGYNDLILNYYGTAGTGIKNRNKTYIYDPLTKNFIYDSLFSSLTNISFYLNKKTITEFYIGHGSGSGTQLEWINGKWIKTKTFSVDQNTSPSEWVVEFPLLKKRKIIKKQYQMLPPKEVLETSY